MIVAKIQFSMLYLQRFIERKSIVWPCKVISEFSCFRVDTKSMKTKLTLQDADDCSSTFLTALFVIE